jgi:hypothetical protein
MSGKKIVILALAGTLTNHTALIMALETYFGRVQIFGDELEFAKYCQKQWTAERADQAVAETVQPVAEMVRNRGWRLSTHGPIRSPVYRRGKRRPHCNRPVRVPSRSSRRGLSRFSGYRSIALSHLRAPHHRRRREGTIASSRRPSVAHSRIGRIDICQSRPWRRVRC